MKSQLKFTKSKLKEDNMVPEEEKILKLAKSTVFVLIMLSLSSFFEPEGVLILLLSLIYLKEG